MPKSTEPFKRAAFGKKWKWVAVLLLAACVSSGWSAFLPVKRPSAPVLSTFNTLNRYRFLYYRVFDPLFSTQWNLENSGTYPFECKADADIDALAAWQYTRGENDIVIAVVEHSGSFDLDHPDLEAALIPIEPDEIRDFDTQTAELGLCSPRAGYIPYHHGTSVLGIMAAQHNGIGVAGLAPGCRYLPMKASSALHKAMAFHNLAGRAASGVKIAAINCSWREPDANGGIMGSGIEACYDQDIVIVMSAGNNGLAPQYPATDEDVICVAAMLANDQLADYSSQGPAVDIAAPAGPGPYVGSGNPPNISFDGRHVPTTVVNGFGHMSGTSAAAPHVAGTVGLLRSLDETLSIEEIKTILYSSADKTGTDKLGNPIQYDCRTGRSDLIGHGRLNAGKACALASFARSQTDILLYSYYGAYGSPFPVRYRSSIRYQVDATWDAGVPANQRRVRLDLLEDWGVKGWFLADSVILDDSDGSTYEYHDGEFYAGGNCSGYNACYSGIRRFRAVNLSPGTTDPLIEVHTTYIRP
jgi:hypothetical protein